MFSKQHIIFSPYRESVFRCRDLASQFISKFIFMIASNSARLMYLVSYSGCSQHTSSIAVTHNTSWTPVAKKVVLTHMSRSLLLLPIHLSMRWLDFVSILLWGVSLVWLSHPLVPVLALCLIMLAATCCQLHIEKCPVSFPQRENILSLFQGHLGVHFCVFKTVHHLLSIQPS